MKSYTRGRREKIWKTQFNIAKPNYNLWLHPQSPLLLSLSTFLHHSSCINTTPPSTCPSIISHCCHQTLATIGPPPLRTWLSQTTTLGPSRPIDHQLLVATGHYLCFPPLITIIIGNLMQLNGIIFLFFFITKLLKTNQFPMKIFSIIKTFYAKTTKIFCSWNCICLIFKYLYFCIRIFFNRRISCPKLVVDACSKFLSNSELIQNWSSMWSNFV